MKFLTWIINSRKAKLIGAAVTAILTAWFTGQITAEVAMYQITIAVVGLVLGVAIEDAGEKSAPTLREGETVILGTLQETEETAV